MSNIKSPQEKKRLSLKLDRRNSYGENNKSSRKNISLSKARSHRDARRVVGQTLAEALTHPSQESIDVVGAKVLSVGRKKKIEAFRKWPDASLGATIVKKLARRKADLVESSADNTDAFAG